MKNIPDIVWILGSLGFIGLAWMMLRTQGYRFVVAMGFAAMGVMLVPGIHIGILPAIGIFGLLFGHLKFKNLPIDKTFWSLQLILWFFFFLSNILNPFAGGMFARILGNAIFAVFVLLWLREEKDAKTMIIGLILGFCYSVPLGIGVIAGIVPEVSFILVPNYLETPRFSGLFGDANVMSMLAAFLFMLLLDDLVSRTFFKKGAWLKVLFLAALIGVILAAGSRSGILNLVTAIPLYLLFQFKNASKGVVTKLSLATGAALAMVVAALVLTPLGEVTYDMIVGRTQEEGGAGSRATRTLNAALVLANEYPLGVGTGMTITKADFAAGITDRVQPHNSFVQILVENGVGAALCLFAVVIYSLIRLAPLAWAGRRVAGLDTGAVFASCIGWLWMFNGYDLSWIQIGWFAPAVGCALWMRASAPPAPQPQAEEGVPLPA